MGGMNEGLRDFDHVVMARLTVLIKKIFWLTAALAWGSFRLLILRRSVGEGALRAENV